MPKFPKLGKVDPKFFESVILPNIGARRDEVLHGPNVGLDNGVIQIDEENVLVVTTDPLSYIPELGPKDSAWISAHLIASDLVTSGLMPQYAVINLNLPPDLEVNDFQIYWESLHAELAQMGTAVVAGHTGRYSGCDFTIVGSGTLMAIGAKSAYLSPELARPGDQIVMTKGPMVGTAGLLARVFPETISIRFGEEFLGRAQQLFMQYATIDDAQTAVSIGVREDGVTSMHDVAEGGVLGALYELAVAANAGIKIELDQIPIVDEVKEIAELFGLDLYSSLSEGTLLITVKEQKCDELLAALREAGILAEVIGALMPIKDNRVIVENGKEREFEPPIEDGYWDVYQRVKANGWK